MAKSGVAPEDLPDSAREAVRSFQAQVQRMRDIDNVFLAGLDRVEEFLTQANCACLAAVPFDTGALYEPDHPAAGGWTLSSRLDDGRAVLIVLKDSGPVPGKSGWARLRDQKNRVQYAALAAVPSLLLAMAKNLKELADRIETLVLPAARRLEAALPPPAEKGGPPCSTPASA